MDQFFYFDAFPIERGIYTMAMSEFKENKFSAKLKVSKKKDVVVIGGGPASCLAAIAARRNGADTLLIEKEGYPGGNMTGTLITSLHGHRLHKNYSSKITTSSWD
jgi:NADPH-dependent 2,4-dienoyl-CoA reductase/sulfur reductase-like enzyme